MNAAAQKVIATAHERNEFGMMEDGFYCYWPSEQTSGAYTAWHMRALADELDRINAKWALQLASCDTHPKDGDVKQAPLVSGAVPKADAQQHAQPPSPSE